MCVCSCILLSSTWPISHCDEIAVALMMDLAYAGWKSGVLRSCDVNNSDQSVVHCIRRSVCFAEMASPPQNLLCSSRNWMQFCPSYYCSCRLIAVVNHCRGCGGRARFACTDAFQQPLCDSQARSNKSGGRRHGARR